MKIMKTQLSEIFLLLIALLSISLTTKADYTKKVYKSWPVKSVNSLYVENKFGNVNFINTRDDSVTIDIIVTIKGLPESKARMMASDINFEFSIENGKVTAETIFDSNFKGEKDFNIVYTVNIPINRFIDVKNKFGNVTLGDLTTGGNFDIAYGNIQGKTLVASGDKSIDLELKYGNATFEKINTLNADIEYSKFNAQAIGKALLDTKYSTVVIQKCLEMITESEYDSYNFNNVENISVESKFTGFKIDELLSSMNINTEYGDIFVKHVSKNFNKLKVDNKFGNIKIAIDSDASYNLVSDTEFCEIKFPKGDVRKSIKDDFKKYYEVKIGNENPVSSVKIISKHGNVDLME
jgi:hypothetical protein